ATARKRRLPRLSMRCGLVYVPPVIPAATFPAPDQPTRADGTGPGIILPTLFSNVTPLLSIVTVAPTRKRSSEVSKVAVWAAVWNHSKVSCFGTMKEGVTPLPLPEPTPPAPLKPPPKQTCQTRLAAAWRAIWMIRPPIWYEPGRAIRSEGPIDFDPVHGAVHDMRRADLGAEDAADATRRDDDLAGELDVRGVHAGTCRYCSRAADGHLERVARDDEACEGDVVTGDHRGAGTERGVDDRARRCGRDRRRGNATRQVQRTGRRSRAGLLAGACNDRCLARADRVGEPDDELSRRCEGGR